MAVSIADRNQRITVQQNEAVTDRIGNHTSAWADFLELWANVTITASTEGTEAGITSMRQTIDRAEKCPDYGTAQQSLPDPVRRRDLQHYRCDAVLYQWKSGTDYSSITEGKIN